MRLVLGDDHQMFLEALVRGLISRGHDVVGFTDTLDDLVELVDVGRPDLCLLDVDFGGRSVLEAAGRIRRERPEVPIVLLSGSAGREVWRAFEAGLVEGIVNKVCDISVVDRTIRRVHAGERVVERFPRPVADRHRAAPTTELSDRENAVVRLLVEGASTEQIARALGVSAHTVRTHVQSVLRKYGVNTRAKAVGHAVAHGLRPGHDPGHDPGHGPGHDPGQPADA